MDSFPALPAAAVAAYTATAESEAGDLVRDILLLRHPARHTETEVVAVSVLGRQIADTDSAGVELDSQNTAQRGFGSHLHRYWSTTVSAGAAPAELGRVVEQPVVLAGKIDRKRGNTAPGAAVAAGPVAAGVAGRTAAVGHTAERREQEKRGLTSCSDHTRPKPAI